MIKTKKRHYKNKNKIKFTKKGGAMLKVTNDIDIKSFLNKKMMERYKFCNEKEETIDYDKADFLYPNKELIKRGSGALYNGSCADYKMEILGKMNNNIFNKKDDIFVVYPDFHGSFTDLSSTHYKKVPDNHILCFLTEPGFSGIVSDDWNLGCINYLKSLDRENLNNLMNSLANLTDTNNFNSRMIEGGIFSNCFNNASWFFPGERFINCSISINKYANTKYQKIFKKINNGIFTERIYYNIQPTIHDFIRNENNYKSTYIYFFTICRSFKFKDKDTNKERIDATLYYELIITYININIMKEHIKNNIQNNYVPPQKTNILCSSISRNKDSLVSDKQIINPIFNKNRRYKYLYSKHTDNMIYLYNKILSKDKINKEEVLLFISFSLGKKIFFLEKLIRENIDKKIIKGFAVLIIDMFLKKSDEIYKIHNYKLLFAEHISNPIDSFMLDEPGENTKREDYICNYGNYYFLYKEQILTFLEKLFEIGGNSNLEFRKIIDDQKKIFKKTISNLGYIYFVNEKKYIYNNIYKLFIDDISRSIYIYNFILDLQSHKYLFNNLESIHITSNGRYSNINQTRLENFIKLANGKNYNILNNPIVIKYDNMIFKNRDPFNIIINKNIKDFYMDSIEINNINITFNDTEKESFVIFKNSFIGNLTINNESNNKHKIKIEVSSINKITINNPNIILILDSITETEIEYKNNANQELKLLFIIGLDSRLNDNIPDITTTNGDIKFEKLSLSNIYNNKKKKNIKCKKLYLEEYDNSYPDNVECDELILDYITEKNKSDLLNFIKKLIKTNLKIINRKKTHYKINNFKKEFKINNRLQKKIRVI